MVTLYTMDERKERRLVARLTLAEGVTRTGDAVTQVALPLTAVLVLDATPVELAFIGLAQAIPIFALSIPVGAWVDRRRHRWTLLIGADVARAGLLTLVPVLAALGYLTLPLLAAITFLVGVAGTLFDLSFAGWVRDCSRATRCTRRTPGSSCRVQRRSSPGRPLAAPWCRPSVPRSRCSPMPPHSSAPLP
jgi:MFS family permease